MGKLQRAASAIVAMVATIFGASDIRAQPFPTRPITLVVPAAAGGPTDTLARILADRLQARLKQSVIIENNGAASGSVALGRVARATPDGYTAVIGHYGHFVMNGAIYNLQYDLVDGFEPVALVASNPQLISARPSLPATDLRAFIAWLLANPGKASQGTAGAGSPAHVSGLYFQKMTGANFLFVPYRGTAPAMQDLMSGNIDFIFDQASNSLPQARAGTIKAFAVTADKRLASAPEIPTADEAGLPGFRVAVWHGVFLPKGTPRAIVETLNAALVDVIADAPTRARLADLGQDVPPREMQTPEGLRAYQKAEADKWQPLIKAAGIKPE